ncbi:MAG: hypothetical protein Q8N99_04695 [Nanoarchaeota archaeon]|nr:hypothetical protein [Nanoarchaeota archaeon]
MKDDLESSIYPTIMYILILAVTLGLFFNLVDISYRLLEKAPDTTNKITGYISYQYNISENTTNPDTTKEMYSENSYAAFYLIILSILIVITLLTVRIIMPRIKHLT